MKLTLDNLILNTDSYKFSHYLQFPPDTTNLSYYIESRGYAKHLNGSAGHGIVHLGIQPLIKQYLCQPITKDDVIYAKQIINAHGEPFNEAGWMQIVEKEQGILPLEIYAVPEGTIVHPHQPVVEVRSTLPGYHWLPGHLETMILRAVWYPSTVATISRNIKILLAAYMDMMAGHRNGLEFKLHDFGARGVSSRESAAIGGCAHLVNFAGTDTVSAILAARAFYDADIAGYSIPAMEHSTVTSWSRDREQDAYANMIDKCGGKGKLVAAVSDSYDLYGAIEHIWGDALRSKVVGHGGTVVIRPDSGDPATVVVNCLDLLGVKFGWRENDKQYRVLPDCVRVIQGDGVNYDSIKKILIAMNDKRWSIENIAFGMGGALLQQVNRDTLKYAMKASAILTEKSWPNWQPIGKDPVTDPGKKSKMGEQRTDQMVAMYKWGQLVNEATWDEVKSRAAI